MKFFRIIIILIIPVILTACWQQKEQPQNTKKAFIIETKKTSSFPKSISFQKPGKIIGEKEITVASQVIGKVNKIKKKEWDTVSWGQPTIEIEDNIANYKLQLDIAKSSLDSSLLNYDQTQTALTKSVADAKLNYEKAQHTFNSIQKTSEQSLKQAKQNLNSSDLWTNSQSKLNLEKMIIDIENQITTLKAQLNVQKSQIKNILNDVLHQSDALLGVSAKYKDGNNNIEHFLWAKNSTIKNDAKYALLLLYKEKINLSQLQAENISNKELKDQINIIEKTYPKIQKISELMQEVLRNSVSSNNLPQTSINTYISIFNSLSTATTATFAQFVAYQNQVNSLLPNADTSTNDKEQIKNLAQQQIEITLQKAINTQSSAKIAYDTTNINIENNLFNADLALKSAKIAYDTAKSNKKTQLKLLNNAITQAKINYQNIKTQLNKLSVRAPIAGILWTILVDEWQEVGIGQPLFIVTSYKKQQIEIYINSDEFEYIKKGQNVIIKNWKDLMKGKIKSISQIANKNILYKTIITPENNLELIWEIVEVHIPIKLSKRALPINIITSKNDNNWYIYILENNQPIKYDIKLWKSRGNKIEINSKLKTNLKIITTDIWNYDPQNFNLVVKQTK